MSQDKDYLDGAIKVKKIMNNRTVYCCRTCGMSFPTHQKAAEHCKKVKARFNKNRHLFQKVYDKIRGA